VGDKTIVVEVREVVKTVDGGVELYGEEVVNVLCRDRRCLLCVDCLIVFLQEQGRPHKPRQLM
jgi:hypothetical protein